MTTSTALARIEFSDRDVALIKASFMPENSTDDELRYCIKYASHMGLDPFAKQIYFIKRKGKIVPQIAVDGYRALAEATGEYEGQTRPEWCDDDGNWREVWLDDFPPAAARVGIYRHGFRGATEGLAVWREYVQKDSNGNITDMWLRMPGHQLAKCAEVDAFKRTFPQIYLESRRVAREEGIDQIEDEGAIDIEATELPPEPPPTPKPKPGPMVAPSVAPDRDAEEKAWRKWETVSREHGWEPLRLRYYLGKPAAAAVTAGMLKAWKAEHPEHGYDSLIALAIEGETAQQEAADAFADPGNGEPAPEQGALEVG